MRRSAAALVACVLLALTACAPTAGEEGTAPRTLGPPSAGAPAAGAVDTPALRRLKQQADIAACPRTDPSAGALTDGLPAVSLPCLGGGRPVALAGLRGTPMVVNFWASWCTPCREELPYFAQLDEDARDRVLVIGVDFADPDPAAALELAADTGITYPQLADPESESRIPLQLIGLPQTVFVDAEGHVTGIERRSVASYAELVGLVDEHLGVSL
ncbi:MAG: TlpA disulfide reductase family protein [Nocardioidaceae bacterium]